jgi:hypothetical protein
LKSGAWRPWKIGFERRKSAQQREGFVCDNGAFAKVQRGASQTVVLDEKSPAPIAAAVWSKAEKVGGVPDSDYSLYLDLVCADGTPLWGPVAPFATGTHGWRKARVVVLPEKPVCSVTVNLLLRRHAGRAWFRDPVLVGKRAGAEMRKDFRRMVPSRSSAGFSFPNPSDRSRGCPRSCRKRFPGDGTS